MVEGGPYVEGLEKIKYSHISGTYRGGISGAFAFPPPPHGQKDPHSKVGHLILYTGKLNLY